MASPSPGALAGGLAATTPTGPDHDARDERGRGRGAGHDRHAGPRGRRVRHHCPDQRQGLPRPAGATTSATAPERVAPARRAPSVVVAEPPVLLSLPGGRGGARPLGRDDACGPPRRTRRRRPGRLVARRFAAGRPLRLDPGGRTRRLADPGPRPLRRAADGLPRRPHPPGFGAPDADVRGAVPAAGAPGLAGPRDLALRRLGERRLTLVTCAPPYVASRGGYQNLAVVTAVPVSPAERR